MTSSVDVRTPPQDHAPLHAARPRRRGALRRVVTAFLAVALVVSAIVVLTIDGWDQGGLPTVTQAAPTTPLALARYDAAAFLTRYLDPNGRVVRRDQGGDTVSEGQAYAMLLAVAIDSPAQFKAAWSWEQANLQLPDGLFSYHWADGTVVGSQPATDADLDSAWALELAAQRFHDPAYRADGSAVAAAILAHETVTVNGQIELAAGPWATTTPPYVINPSYDAPEALGALASATGDPVFSQLAQNAQALEASLIGSSPVRLPSDWATIDITGAVRASGAPSTSGSPQYGLDAQRLPVWDAASCSGPTRMLAASLWPDLHTMKADGARLEYSTTGGVESNLENPLGLVAAAAAADASGAKQEAATLLDRADSQSNRYHTYYGDAWVALGRVLLDTNLLSPCAPSPATH